SEYHLKALDIHYKHMEIGKKLFLEPNPAPVKAALHMLGLIPSESIRMPMLPMTAAGKEVLMQSLVRLGKLQ
ncbi:dihydrodipicolinate synthase family protein, partial [Candidatus Micrarchaeota archaeon]|nr:dihydrodipicolinate synthase family protein [Candidatus Micrarchaeota archaeon]